MRLFRKSSAAEPAGPAETGPSQAGPAVAEDLALEPLTNVEIDWARSNIAGLAEQDVRLGDIDDLGRHYDELLDAWVRLDESQRPDPDAIITQIGLGFGQYVADRAKLDWTVATDQHGAELALHSSRGNVLIYPINLVAQHWAAQDRGVLPGLAREIIATVEEIP